MNSTTEAAPCSQDGKAGGEEQRRPRLRHGGNRQENPSVLNPLRECLCRPCHTGYPELLVADDRPRGIRDIRVAGTGIQKPPAPRGRVGRNPEQAWKVWLEGEVIAECANGTKGTLVGQGSRIGS